MTSHTLLLAATGVCALSLAVMAVFGVLNTVIASLALSDSPLLDLRRLRRRMDSLFAANLRVSGPFLVAVTVAISLVWPALPESGEALSRDSGWVNIPLIVPLAFAATIAWLTFARQYLAERLDQREISVQSREESE